VENQINQCEIRRPGQLLIEGTNLNGQITRGIGLVVAGIVMSGGNWHDGVVVEGFDDFTNDVIGYAINEGNVLFDVIDGDGERIDQPWRVIGVSSETLARLGLINAKLAPGLLVRLADNCCLNVREDGWIGDGEYAVASMLELKGGFEVEVENGSV